MQKRNSKFSHVITVPQRGFNAHYICLLIHSFMTFSLYIWYIYIFIYIHIYTHTDTEIWIYFFPSVQMYMNRGSFHTFTEIQLNCLKYVVVTVEKVHLLSFKYRNVLIYFQDDWNYFPKLGI